MDEERTVHSFGVWGVGLGIDSLVLLTQRVLKRKTLFLVLFTHLVVLLPVPFDEAALFLEFPIPYLSQTPMDQPCVLGRITSSPIRLYRVSIIRF